MGNVATAQDRKHELAVAFSDSARFRSWYDDAVNRVYAYLHARSGADVELAEELTQQTFVQAVRHWQSFDGRADSVTWLCTIARHKLADHYRERERQKRRQLHLIVREIPVADDDLELSVSDRDAVVNALRTLPDIERTALLLRYVDDLSVGDVAATIGRSVDATDALLRRAKQRFRSIYPEALDD